MMKNKNSPYKFYFEYDVKKAKPMAYDFLECVLETYIAFQFRPQHISMSFINKCLSELEVQP